LRQRHDASEQEKSGAEKKVAFHFDRSIFAALEYYKDTLVAHRVNPPPS
jgi:hypothetical protein